MRHHRHRERAWVAAATVVSVVLGSAILLRPLAAQAATGIAPDNPCLTAPEDINHDNIRLDEPAEGTRVPVDDHGKITVSGVLHKQANMDDVTVGSVVTTAFTFGPPPDGVSDWAASWTTSVRPPHLGPIELCARAHRDPKWKARVLRDVTVVDLIPPSNVPNLSIVDVTATSAKVTWGEATDNYGLAGYEISVDGGPATRTTVGTRSYAITGLPPSTDHSVSVVAIDLAGNSSVTAATASFTTTAVPPPPNPDTDLIIDAHQGYATVSWHPTATELTDDDAYEVILDGWDYATIFPFDYCQDANGNPASACTPDDVISYSVGELDDGTPYTVEVQALAADLTPIRTMVSTFTTLSVAPPVPAATTALIATDSSRCAAEGGAFYVSPSMRGQVPIPAGSTLKFAGCYTANNDCIGPYLRKPGNNVITCSDDVTNLLYSVAPPGRGPVIPSMDAVANDIRTPQLSSNPVAEPIKWCTNNVDPCVIIVSKATEAVEDVVLAEAALSVADFLVVGAAGIGLGLALFFLLDILFPQSRIGYDGLFEYPVHPDTNFDTFDNWGADNGEWYLSLQIYAEVIKTTKELAAARNLPFVWTQDEDNQLKRSIDSACGAQRGSSSAIGCNVDDLAVYVPGGTNYRNETMQETGRHIASAMDAGNGFPLPGRQQWHYPARSKNGMAAIKATYKHTWYDTDPRFNALNPCTTRVKATTTCDEFPFWSTNQAVDLSGTLASLKPVPRAEQNPQRDDLSGFYGKCKVGDGGHFMVLPVPSWVEANGPSFGFKVEKGGTDLCMEPQPPSTTTGTN